MPQRTLALVVCASIAATLSAGTLTVAHIGAQQDKQAKQSLAASRLQLLDLLRDSSADQCTTGATPSPTPTTGGLPVPVGVPIPVQPGGSVVPDLASITAPLGDAIHPLTASLIDAVRQALAALGLAPVPDPTTLFGVLGQILGGGAPPGGGGGGGGGGLPIPIPVPTDPAALILAINQVVQQLGLGGVPGPGGGFPPVAPDPVAIINALSALLHQIPGTDLLGTDPEQLLAAIGLLLEDLLGHVTTPVDPTPVILALSNLVNDLPGGLFDPTTPDKVFQVVQLVLDDLPGGLTVPTDPAGVIPALAQLLNNLHLGFLNLDDLLVSLQALLLDIFNGNLPFVPADLLAAIQSLLDGLPGGLVLPGRPADVINELNALLAQVPGAPVLPGRPRDIVPFVEAITGFLPGGGVGGVPGLPTNPVDTLRALIALINTVPGAPTLPDHPIQALRDIVQMLGNPPGGPPIPVNPADILAALLTLFPGNPGGPPGNPQDTINQLLVAVNQLLAVLPGVGPIPGLLTDPVALFTGLNQLFSDLAAELGVPLTGNGLAAVLAHTLDSVLAILGVGPLAVPGGPGDIANELAAIIDNVPGAAEQPVLVAQALTAFLNGFTGPNALLPATANDLLAPLVTFLDDLGFVVPGGQIPTIPLNPNVIADTAVNLVATLPGLPTGILDGLPQDPQQLSQTLTALVDTIPNVQTVPAPLAQQISDAVQQTTDAIRSAVALVPAGIGVPQVLPAVKSDGSTCGAQQPADVSTPAPTPTPQPTQTVYVTPTPTPQPTQTVYVAPTPTPTSATIYGAPVLTESNSGDSAALEVTVSSRYAGYTIQFFRRSGQTGQVASLGQSLVDDSGHAVRVLNNLAHGQLYDAYAKILGAQDISSSYSNDVSWQVQ